MSTSQRQVAQFSPSLAATNDHNRTLLEAAVEFAQWVNQHAPGATVMLCGGLAFTQYGSQRTTKDVDLCMDLRNAVRHDNQTRRVDVNALKSMASTDSRLIVGPKIFWKHSTTGTYVQVDFIDANLFYAPFDYRRMVDSSIAIPSLNLPTLLVGKIRTALQRNQSDTSERSHKHINDFTDFEFAVQQCVIRQIPLTMSHLGHLGTTIEDQVNMISDFTKLRLSYLQANLDMNALGWIPAWTQPLTRPIHCGRSGFYLMGSKLLQTSETWIL
ncbi:hypothetical protein C8Q75DRAFT_406803 [Abortiporus biennis]|nr:hypothetical protein C8Q75DRAFT_406803 [Abortiporus biennis]